MVRHVVVRRYDHLLFPFATLSLMAPEARSPPSANLSWLASVEKTESPGAMRDKVALLKQQSLLGLTGMMVGSRKRLPAIFRCYNRMNEGVRYRE